MTEQLCSKEGCNESRATHANVCKKHHAEAVREWRKANPERAAEHARRWAEKNVERLKEYRREYYEQNKDAIDAYNKAWREANPDKVRQMQAEWRRANEGHTYKDSTGYVKYIGYEHPAANPSGVTGYHRIVLWDKLNGQDVPCHWCGQMVHWDKSEGEALVVDHVNTVKDDNSPENLVPACNHCNMTREGGRNYTHVKTVVGECVFEGCNRDAKAFSKDKTMLLCAGHWQQDNSGRELSPLRVRKVLYQDDNGRVCTGCEEYKSWDNYGLTSDKKRHRPKCKACMVAVTQQARQRRLEANGPCSEEGCNRTADLKGLCSVHYHRAWAGAK